jgi:hypothetical protein
MQLVMQLRLWFGVTAVVVRLSRVTTSRTSTSRACWLCLVWLWRAIGGRPVDIQAKIVDDSSLQLRLSSSCHWDSRWRLRHPHVMYSAVVCFSTAQLDLIGCLGEVSCKDTTGGQHTAAHSSTQAEHTKQNPQTTSPRVDTHTRNV